MADFEGLIRQALARQNEADPAVRQKVYQSSRNALARMIAAAGPQPPSVIIEQRAALENSINRIEAGYPRGVSAQNAIPGPAAPQTAAPVARPQNAPAGNPVQTGITNPASSTVSAGSRPGSRPTSPAAEWPKEPMLMPTAPAGKRNPPRTDPLLGPDDFDPRLDEVQAPESEFDISADARVDLEGRRPWVRIATVLGLVLLILSALGWLTYTAVDLLLSSGEKGAQISTSGSGSGAGQADENSNYVTILSPQDTASLQTDGRGKAEIVNQSNTEMIRLVSVRADDKRSVPAQPILLAIPEGVLQQVAGKQVTVEIRAKSGMDEPATFAVGCDFNGADACGRKRFRVDQQPEDVVFTATFPDDAANGGKYFLAISTDVTSDSSVSSEGDPVDIISARLRFPKE